MKWLELKKRMKKLPTYTIRNKKTGKEHDEFMSISEMETYIKDHPEEEVMCGAPRIGYTFNRLKPDQGFKDRLREIKKAHPLGNVNVDF